jgi:hypothetical protein
MVKKSSGFWDITPCSTVKVNRRFGGTYCLLYAGFLHGLLFNPEDEGDAFIRTVGSVSADYTALYPRRKKYSGTRVPQWV